MTRNYDFFSNEYNAIKNTMARKNQEWEKCNIPCPTCPLFAKNNPESMYCHSFERWHETEAKKLVLKYLRTHRDEYEEEIKKLLEKYPHLKMYLREIKK